MCRPSASLTASEPTAPPPSASTGDGPREQPQDELLLARAEGGLASRSKNDSRGSPSSPSSSRSEVEWLDAQLGRDGAGGARLAGTHEAHEHEGVAVGRLRCSQRLHPMRSR